MALVDLSMTMDLGDLINLAGFSVVVSLLGYLVGDKFAGN